MRNESPFNPLDKKNLGESVADAMLARDPIAMPPKEPFIGAGIYAIYYIGNFPPYKPIAQQNLNDEFSAPIYVGKAVPAGARKGGFGLGENPGPVLYNRLTEHAESISQARNLKLEHFRCRYLTVDDIWIPLGESLLIHMFKPLWNQCLDGFGNHDPGSGRTGQKRSPWDVIHPGRPWADKLTGKQKTEAEILADIKAFFARPKPEEATIKKPKKSV